MERISSLATVSVLSGLLLGAGSTAAAAAASAAGSNAALLSWAAPTINADGSKLSDLLGFNVYRGTSPTSMMLAASLTAGTNTYADSNLTPSVWYWYITAVNSLGVESAPSPTVSKVITADAGGGGPTAPGPAPGSTPGSSSGTPSAGIPSGGTPAAGAPGSSGGQGAANEGAGTPAAESPYRASALSAISRRSLCRPVGMVVCFH